MVQSGRQEAVSHRASDFEGGVRLAVDHDAAELRVGVDTDEMSQTKDIDSLESSSLRISLDVHTRSGNRPRSYCGRVVVHHRRGGCGAGEEKDRKERRERHCEEELEDREEGGKKDGLEGTCLLRREGAANSYTNARRGRATWFSGSLPPGMEEPSTLRLACLWSAHYISSVLCPFSSPKDTEAVQLKTSCTTRKRCRREQCRIAECSFTRKLPSSPWGADVANLLGGSGAPIVKASDPKIVGVGDLQGCSGRSPHCTGERKRPSYVHPSIHPSDRSGNFGQTAFCCLLFAKSVCKCQGSSLSPSTVALHSNVVASLLTQTTRRGAQLPHNK